MAGAVGTQVWIGKIGRLQKSGDLGRGPPGPARFHANRPIKQAGIEMRLASKPTVRIPPAEGPSMAMTRRKFKTGTSFKFDPGTETLHQVCKTRKAGVDGRPVIDGDGLSCGQAQDEKGHGDAMIEMRRDQATSCRG